MTFRTFEQLKKAQLAEDFQVIDRSLAELRALKRDAVGAFDGEKVTPKVCWKIECYLQGLVHRTIALCEGGKSCCNASNLLGAVILARAVLENAAIAFSFYDGIRQAVDAGDLSEINKEVMKVTFASRHDILKGVTLKAPNILGLIDKLDKYLYRNEPDRSVRHVYDFLCEFAHPNWVGTVGLFGKLNEAGHLQYFAEENAVRNGVAGYVIAGLGSALIVQRCHVKVTELLPKVSEISEAPRTKTNL